MRRFEEWRSTQAPVYTAAASSVNPWQRGTNFDAQQPEAEPFDQSRQHGFPSRSQRPAAELDTQELAGPVLPCAEQPHCEDWSRKRSKLSTRKALEYKFLYAASAGCATCMRFYSGKPGFNVHCVSTRMNARGWASWKGKRIPDDVEALLQTLSL